ncbi:hypothetical protein ANO11243_018280 [Dothideomycetidae sp. 11243]|nr:hypothetical protein ANO11243_018280 [fungal sp. No.11243]
MRQRGGGGAKTDGRELAGKARGDDTYRPGERPSQALKRNHNAWRDLTEAYEELFRGIRALPERQATDVYRSIRAGFDVRTLLNQVKGGDLVLQLAVAPETRFWYELPYHAELPESLRQDNPYLDCLLYEATSVMPPAWAESSSPASIASNPEYRSLYVQPFHAAHTIDPRIANAKPSLWTSVCADDGLMRDLLADFFLCEYAFTSAFQKDQFLEDMAALRTEFCSSLLVNVVLAYACACCSKMDNRAEYWNPHTLLYRFFAEARRLWELEATEPCITTVQAGVVFNVVYNLCGLDEIGQVYRINSIALAYQLRLFEPIFDANDRTRRGKIYTAWMLFSWEAMYYHHLLLTIFEPLLDSPTSNEPSPQKITAESDRRLQTLFRLYYLRHGYEAMDFFIVIPLMFTSVKCLDAIDRTPPPPELETLRATLVLVASGLYTQRKNHYLAEVLYRVVRARMRPQEAELLKMAAGLDEEGEQQLLLRQKVRSHWPVSVIRKKEDLDSQILANLVKSLRVHA